MTLYKTLLAVLLFLTGTVIGTLIKPTEYIEPINPPTIIIAPKYRDMGKVACMAEYRLVDPNLIVWPTCDCSFDYDQGWEDGISQFSTECQVR